jgi:hypothetical protein
MSRLSQTQAFNDIDSDPDYSSQCEKLSPEEKEEQEQANHDQIITFLLVDQLFQ